MKQVVRLLLLGTIASTLAADIRTKREKRSYWPSFLGGGGSSIDGADDDIENETIPEGVANVAANPQLQPFVFPKDIRLPGQLQSPLSGVPYTGAVPPPILNQGNLHYPIYRVHKYNGVHLNPIPVSLVAQTVSNPHVEIPGQATVPVFEIPGQAAVADVPIIDSNTEDDEDESEGNDEETDNETIEAEKKKTKKPIKGKKQQLKITPELIKLARKLGIKDVTQIPDLSAAMDLLGTTTQQETIEIIMELAETDEGLALIKKFINADNSNQDNAPAKKEKKPIKGKKTQLKITPELIKLGMKLGITDVTKIPDLSGAMDLLGTTTQEETIQTIMELAETEDGLMLIKQFINTDNSDQDIDTDSSDQENAPAKKDKKPIKAKKTQLKITPELIKLGMKLGITDVSKIPDLSGAMDLLGTTTQEETIQTIMELAETEDGLMLIKQFINTDNSDQDNAASEVIESIALPRSNGEPVAQASSVVAVNALNPLRAFDATLDRTRNSLGILSPFVPTPAPTLLGRISQFANIFNPFAPAEIPIPPIGEADAEEFIDTDDDEEQARIVSTGTVPIPQLPHLPQLPTISEIDTHSIEVPQLPQLHIPHSYVLPPSYKSGAGGPYIRVKLPLNGFNPTPEIPIHPQYLRQYQQQLALQRGAQVVQQSHHFTPGVTVAVHTPHSSIQVGPLSKSPGKVEANHPVPLNRLVPPIHQAPVSHTRPIPAPHHSSQTSHPIPLSHPALTSHPAPPVIHSTDHAPRPAPISPHLPAPISPHLPAPATQLLPPIHAARPLQAQTVATANVQTASHVGHLPLSDSNYDIFKNAPRIVTSYGTPTLPYTFPEDKPNASFSSSSAFDLRPASSDVHERSVLPGPESIAKEAVEAKSAAVLETTRSEIPEAEAKPAAVSTAVDTSISVPSNDRSQATYSIEKATSSVRATAAASDNSNKISKDPLTQLVPEETAPLSEDVSRTVNIAGSDNTPMVILSDDKQHTASQVLDAARATIAALDLLDSLPAKPVENKPHESEAVVVRATAPDAEPLVIQAVNDEILHTSDNATPALRAPTIKQSTDTRAASPLPETAAASTVSRRQAMLQRRSSNYIAHDEFGNRLNRSKPQRASGLQSYATGKLHTADPEVVKMLPLTMRQAIKGNRQ